MLTINGSFSDIPDSRVPIPTMPIRAVPPEGETQHHDPLGLQQQYCATRKLALQTVGEPGYIPACHIPHCVINKSKQRVVTTINIRNFYFP